MKLGTILPDARLEAISTRVENARLRHNAAIGNDMFGADIARVVGGERRWYICATRYAIIGSDGRARVFTVSLDADGREVSHFYKYV